MFSHIESFLLRQAECWLPKPVKPAWDSVRASLLGKRLVRGVFWTMTGALLSRSMSFVTGVLVARMLGREGVGELGIIQSTIGMFGVMAGFGIGTTATKYVAEYRMRDPEKAGRILGLTGLFALGSGAVMGLALALAANWLAIHSLNAPHLAGLLRVSALLLLFSAMNGAQAGALAGFEAFRTIASRNLGAALLTLPVLIAGVYYAGVKGAIIALIIGQIINLVFNHIAINYECKKNHIRVNYTNAISEKEILLGFSLPVFLSPATSSLVNWLINALLVKQANGYEQLGIYTVGVTVSGILSMLTGFMITPLFSLMNNNNSKKLNDLNVYLPNIISAFIAITIVAFPEVYELIYGKNFSGKEFRFLVLIIIISTNFSIFRSSASRILMVKNKSNVMFYNSLTCNAINFVAFNFLFLSMGAIGLALSGLLSGILSTIIIWGYVYHKKMQHFNIYHLINFILVLTLITLVGVINGSNSFIIIRLLTYVISIIIIVYFCLIYFIKNNITLVK